MHFTPSLFRCCKLGSMEVRLVYVLASVVILIGYAGGQSTTFRDHPASVTALANFPTALSCSTNLPYPQSIVWRLNGAEAATGVATYDGTTGRSQYFLALLSYTDAGNYTCLALDADSSVLATSRPALLTVQGPPFFLPSLSGLTVQESGEATFTCNVISNPPSSIIWLGPGPQTLSSEGRISISYNVLTISNVQQGDDGFYSCVATNLFGSNTTTARLTFAALTPLEVTITPSESNPLEVTDGNGVTLRCMATANVSISSISWTAMSGRAVADVPVTNNVRLLSITSATSTDSDIYMCSAVDFQGRNASTSIQIIVTRPPVFTTEPADVTGQVGMVFSDKLECIATGIPTPTITWLDPALTQIPLDPSTQLPLIAGGGSLAASDGGVYTCVAANSGGEIRSQFTLTVQGPPTFDTSAMTVTTPPDRDVTLTCTARGSPAPTYSWSKVQGEISGDALQSLTTGSLRLFGVTSDSSGMYTCTATNTIGSATYTATLDVLAQPSILSTTRSPVITLVGSTFFMDCVSTGPAGTVLNWYLNSSLLTPATDPSLNLSPMGRLTVSPAATTHSGLYTCNVSTSFAFTTAQIQVVVGVQPSIVVAPASQDLVPGSNSFLQCLAVGTPPPSSRWTRTSLVTGVMESLDVVGPSYFQLSSGLQLQNVGRNDSGSYVCIVENVLGRSSSSAAVVRVEASPIVSSFSPTTLVVGSNATLTCSTSFNYPSGAITWSRTDGGDPLPSNRFTVASDGTLLVTLVAMEDEGPLTCAVTNQYGRSFITLQVTVQSAPVVNLTNGPTAQGILGESVVLSCDVRGEPRPSVDWIFPSGDSTVSGGGKHQYDRQTGTLSISGFESTDAGTYTCRATNQFGTENVMTVVNIVGPAVPLSVSSGSISRSGFQVLWSDFGFMAQNILDQYELSVATRGRSVNEVVVQETYRFFDRSATVAGLSPGTVYNVMMSGNFFGNIQGLNSSILVTTLESAPTGPPQNLNVTAISEGAILQWMPPAELLRNGQISRYSVQYRLDSEQFYTSQDYIPGNLTDSTHYFTVSELQAGRTYEVRVAAATEVARGPFSATVMFIPLSVFQPLSNQALAIAIGVGVAIGGVVFIVAVVLLVTIVACFIYKKRTKEGKHKPLVDPEKGDKDNRKKKSTISGPVPGITPQVDSSVQGKFRVHGQDGRTIDLKPKVVTAKDVAPRPKKGDSVKRVARQDTILAPSNDDTDDGRIDPYQAPPDAIKPSSRHMSQRYSPPGSGGRTIQRPESGVYSEISDQPQTPPTRRSYTTSEEEDRPYEEVSYCHKSNEDGEGDKYGSDDKRGEDKYNEDDEYEEKNSEDAWDRTAAQESDDGSQVFLTPNVADRKKEAELDRVESESPELPEAPDMGRDDSHLLYSTVPKEYIENKKEKRRLEQEELSEKEAKQKKKTDEKVEKERRKMEEKMERERRKKEEKERKNKEKEEAKLRKQAEADRKRRAKDQQQRESMGLSNIVSYDEMDISGRSRAQARFIDNATAALF